MNILKELGETIALAAFSLAVTSAFCYSIAWCFGMQIVFRQVTGVWLCILWSKIIIGGIAGYARKHND